MLWRVENRKEYTECRVGRDSVQNKIVTNTLKSANIKNPREDEGRLTDWMPGDVAKQGS